MYGIHCTNASCVRSYSKTRVEEVYSKILEDICEAEQQPSSPIQIQIKYQLKKGFRRATPGNYLHIALNIY